MWPYILTFSLSLGSCYLFEHSKGRQIKKIFLIIAVLLPCLLASVRDASIGTDTNGYVINLYKTALNSTGFLNYYSSTFFHEWMNVPILTFDFGYTLITFVVTKLFGSFAVLLFFLEALIIVPITATFIKYKKQIDLSVTFSFFIFYFLYYNTTFNTVRQWISIAFVALAFSYFVLNNDKKHTLLFGIIAVLFHKSALILLILIPLYLLVCGLNDRHKKRISNAESKRKVFLIILLCIAFILTISDTFIPIINSIGLSRYSSYLSGNVQFSINQFIYQLPYLLVIFISKKVAFINNRDDNASTKIKLISLCVFFINVVLSQLSTLNNEAWRSILIFGFYNTILFSYIQKHERRKINSIFVSSVLIIYPIIYWIYTFVIMGSHGTVPFVFG